MDPRTHTGSGFGGRPPLSPGAAARLGPFAIQRELGRGAMGIVLEAIHDTGTRVALKVLTTAPGGSHGAKRFEREVQALASLQHPHIVGFHSASAGPPAWLAMEFVSGGDLEERLFGGPLPYDEGARVVAEVSEAIAYAHSQGMIHRDLKPANILLRASDSAALVTDFGLARTLDASRFTQSGVMVGTLAFMAPEQARGERVLPPCDVWALGALLYVCLTGETPFAADSPFALAAALNRGHFQRPRDLAPSAPPDLESVCLSCLRLDPNDRPTAQEVSEALRERRPLQPLPRGRSRVLLRSLLLLAAAVALVLAGLLVSRREGPPARAASSETPGPSKSPAQPALPAAPWPHSGDLLWTLGEGPAPRLRDPRLWSTPQRAAPLAPAQSAEPGTAVPGFFGPAVALGGGEVRVRYPTQALWSTLPDPGGYFLSADFELDGVLKEEGEGVSIRAPNDSSHVVVQLGRARWDRAQVALEFREVSPVDAREFWVNLGATKTREGERSLSLFGRAGKVGVPGSKAHQPYRPQAEWRALRFAPGAPLGGRVALGGSPLPELEPSLGEFPAAGGVAFTLHEAHQALRKLEVCGVPLRTDLPALAFPDAPRVEQVACAFAWEEASLLGGPLLGLSDSQGRAGYWAELTGKTLSLRRGRRILAQGTFREAPRAGLRAWLSLRRQETAVSVSAGVGDERLELSVLDPLPPPAWPLRACYGSSGPALTFERVEVWADAPDPIWEAEERALARGQEPAEGSRATWRKAALSLAQTSQPEWAVAGYVGFRGRDARRAAARAAAAQLTSLATELPQAAALDAQARALLAWVVAAESLEAERGATRLVAAAGDEARACRALDRLRFDYLGRQSLVDALVRGYVTVLDVRTREAALRAALVLAPPRRAEILYALALNVMHRDPPPDARSPEGRVALEGALELLSSAREAGYENTPELDGTQADYLMSLGRLEESLAPRARACAAKNDWWSWSQRARCLSGLGRSPEALEAALGCLAASPTKPRTHQLLEQLLGRVDPRSHSGLLAATYLATGTVLKRPDLDAHALKLARDAVQDPGSQGDLAAYVLARSGLVHPRPGSTPTAILARARQGDTSARAELPARAKEHSFVLTLVRLDPDLAPLLR